MDKVAFVLPRRRQAGDAISSELTAPRFPSHPDLSSRAGHISTLDAWGIRPWLVQAYTQTAGQVSEHVKAQCTLVRPAPAVSEQTHHQVVNPTWCIVEESIAGLIKITLQGRCCSGDGRW
jgi:hypothetical protein